MKINWRKKILEFERRDVSGVANTRSDREALIKRKKEFVADAFERPVPPSSRIVKE